VNARASFHLLALLVALFGACGIAGFAALTLGGAVGGVVIGVAPERVLTLAEGLICPEGTSLEFSSVRRSYHRPGESEPHVECVGQDGSRQDALAKAILVVIVGAFATVFLAAFVAAAIPLSLAAFFVARAIAKSRG
jgi:hypothetical protein